MLLPQLCWLFIVSLETRSVPLGGSSVGAGRNASSLHPKKLFLPPCFSFFNVLLYSAVNACGCQYTTKRINQCVQLLTSNNALPVMLKHWDSTFCVCRDVLYLLGNGERHWDSVWSLFCYFLGKVSSNGSL